MACNVCWNQGLHARRTCFRIFILIVVERVTKSFWLANILQAVIWSFGHCTYPVEPPYARGIELGFLGIFYGWVMRKYGVLSLIMGHYAFDVYCFVQTLFGSHDIIDWLSAYITMTPLAVLPIMSIGLMYKLGVVPDSDVSNETITAKIIPPAASGEEQGSWPAYKPISRKQMLAAFITAILAGAALALPKPKIGSSANVSRPTMRKPSQLPRTILKN